MAQLQGHFHSTHSRRRLRRLYTGAAIAFSATGMMSVSTIDTLHVHRDARVSDAPPLRVVTPPEAWAYAVSFEVPHDRLPAQHGDALITRVDIEVVSGRVGIGWTNEEGTAYLEERFVPSGRTPVTLTLPLTAVLGRLILRNANLGGMRSEFVLHSVEVEHGRMEPPPYLVKIGRRDLQSEARPVDGGINVFDDEAASTINRARIEWLEAAGLPVSGKRVLDAGCGVGNFASFYLARGCKVVGVDGRSENIAELRRRLPEVHGHVADVQQSEIRALGEFDVVHCFGLLYHLESPAAALRNFAAMCREFVVVETMVCDSMRPVAVLADETKSVNQALEGLGCRLSPSWVVLALNRMGFPWIYGTNRPPMHPDFQFAWNDDLATLRDGHNLRCVFVASRERIERPLLVPLLDQ